MGVLTKGVEGAIAAMTGRNILPMGQDETKKGYSDDTPIRKIIEDLRMNPHEVDVLVNGEVRNVNDTIGKGENVTIMPKQKGGAGALGLVGGLIKRAYVFLLRFIFLLLCAKDILLIGVVAVLSVLMAERYALILAMLFAVVVNAIIYRFFKR